jgi:2-keto-4-pentenoate hydratase/2-oxohepta-3-ene-1,7-dioic acid hydratase in catechol pathway
MKIATFEHMGRRRLGIVSGDGQSVQPLQVPQAAADLGVLALVQDAAAGAKMPAPEGEAIPLAAVTLEAPVPRPRRNLFCVGRNYHEHAKELSASVFKDSNANTAAWPIVFTKVPECVVATGRPVLLPVEVSTQIDYEAELAVVIGRGGRNIRREDAMNHVFGYTIVNDVTARDVQMRHQQWDLGKSFDTFCPMGPWLVTADELEPYRDADGFLALAMTAEVNGRVVGRDLLSNMGWPFEDLIAYASRGTLVRPGDVLGSGTCGNGGCLAELWGRGTSRDDLPPLTVGDVVTLTVEGIGTIANRVVPGADPIPVPAARPRPRTRPAAPVGS